MRSLEDNDPEYGIQLVRFPMTPKSAKANTSSILPFVNTNISDLPAENIGNLSMVIHAYIPDLDPRTHNAPTASQVVAIWINDDIRQNVVQKCDIVLYTQMDQLIHISELNGCYEPLAYPLFFPHGKQGWAPNQIPYRDIPSVPE
ncbi:13220_t:CDS:2 [Entrophospora sp. SA101]|nr:13220_t:CDS:2 [Entrophospora sp. SA101]